MSDLPDVYEDQGLWVYRASALGGCTTGLVAARLGYPAAPPPEAMQQRYDEGHRLEAVVLKELEAQGYEIVSDQEEQEEVELRRGLTAIRGHIDGKAILMLDPADKDVVTLGVEVKSASEESFAKAKRIGVEAWVRQNERPNVPVQLSSYMLATGLPWLYAIKEYTGHGESDGELLVEVIHEPPVSETELWNRVDEVERLAADEELPACDVNQWPCPYFHLHQKEENDGPIVTITEGGEVLEAKLRRIAEIRRLVADLNKEKEALDDEVRPMFSADEKTRVGGIEVNMVPVRREFVDKKQLRKDLGDEAERYITDSVSVQMRLKEVTE